MRDAAPFDRSLLSVLLPLLSYPHDGPATLSDALAYPAPAAVHAALAAFGEAMADRTPTAWEEEFTRALDLSPIAIPYLSIHLFGEESYKRGRMMAWLNDLYAERGFDPGQELPDHLQTVLSFLLTLDDDEAEELAEFCLRNPIAWMTEKLAAAGSPYQHILVALQAVVGEPQLIEGEPIAPSWESYRSTLSEMVPGFDGRSQWEQEFGRE